MKKIAVFASGSGTNAQNLIDYFSTSIYAKVELVLCNKPDAYVIKRAEKMSVPVVVFDREDFYRNARVLDVLIEKGIDLIILAGFLWLVPDNIISEFEGRIVNIHPALLPAYGGKGMYGDRVHTAVIDNKEKESGITIHYVNNKYDDGDIIFQAHCEVKDDDTPDSLAQRIHELEHKYYPKVVEEIIMNS